MSSNLPISSKYRSTPHQLVDDSERDDVTGRLNDAYTEGRFDGDEYQLLLDQVFAARTLGDLVPVVERLPARATHDVPAIVEAGQGRPGELAEGRPMSKMALWLAIGIGIAVALLLILLVMILM